MDRMLSGQDHEIMSDDERSAIIGDVPLKRTPHREANEITAFVMSEVKKRGIDPTGQSALPQHETLLQR